ncbi:unnamed protein product [Porites evermanni]|uniref:Uncharacterized protein n=1 Tax=Porites evermanni TaxID=104178 RepID=A0ABN8T2X8_9CNID|nr:unnamed protein product [Porites evermanni]
MGDNVVDPFEDIDSEEELDKPPTPEIHHGGDSPEAPAAFSDISDNEREEARKDEAVMKPHEEASEKASENDENTSSAQEESKIESKISPVSSTAEQEEEDVDASEKGDKDVPMNEGERSEIIERNSTGLTRSKQESSLGSAEGNDEASRETTVASETTEEKRQEQTSGNTAERRRRISSSAGTDDDLDMPISPLGLGLSGTESEIVDDILKSDVSKLLPDVKEDPREESTGKRDDEEETKEDKESTEAEPTVQDEEGKCLKSESTISRVPNGQKFESDEEAGDQLIADIFGASDEEEEFVVR